MRTLRSCLFDLATTTFFTSTSRSGLTLVIRLQTAVLLSRASFLSAVLAVLEATKPLQTADLAFGLLAKAFLMLTRSSLVSFAELPANAWVGFFTDAACGGGVGSATGAALPPPEACGASVGASRKRGDEYQNGSSSATKPAPFAPTPQFPTAKAVPADATPSRVPDQLAAAAVDVGQTHH